MTANSELLLKYGVATQNDNHDVLLYNTINDEIIIEYNNGIKRTYHLIGEREYPCNHILQPIKLSTNCIYYISYKHIRLPLFRRLIEISSKMPKPLAIVVDCELSQQRTIELLRYAITNETPIISTTEIRTCCMNDMLFKCKYENIARTLGDVLLDNIYIADIFASIKSDMYKRCTTDGIIDWFGSQIGDVSFI